MDYIKKQKMIKSKISGDSIFWGIFMIIPLFGFMLFIYRILKNFTFSISDIFVLLLFILLFYMVINFFKHIKFITIIESKLKYYSVLKPFGKTIDLNTCIGKIISEETGTRGRYKVIYLIDKQNITFFKIMGVHYKNFEQINDSIGLKIIKFNPSITQYFKLLFLEKLNIKNESNNIENIKIILRIFKIIGITGIILFISGLILKKFL